MFFGIDVAQAKLDPGRTDARAVATFDNTPAGHAALADGQPPAAAADTRDADRLIQSVPGVGPQLAELGTT